MATTKLGMKLMQRLKLRVVVNPNAEESDEFEFYSWEAAWQCATREATKEGVEEIIVLDAVGVVVAGVHEGRHWSLDHDVEERAA